MSVSSGCEYVDSVSESGSGSSSNPGGVGVVLGLPERVNAPDFLRNDIKAWMPFLVARITGKDIVPDAFLRVFLYWLYLGHSRRTCSLVWKVMLSQGQDVGSSECGRKVRRNSPV